MGTSTVPLRCVGGSWQIGVLTSKLLQGSGQSFRNGSGQSFRNRHMVLSNVVSVRACPTHSLTQRALDQGTLIPPGRPGHTGGATGPTWAARRVNLPPGSRANVATM